MKLSIYQIFLLMGTVLGHSRWKCPQPRDTNDENGKHISFKNTANKDGPCGLNTGEIYGYNGVTSLNPGLQTFVWEESISHKGAPYRINLLNKKGGIIATILDHIPHNDDAKTTMIEKFYTQYKMTLDIPDVDCKECSLQLLFIMTDKTVGCGLEYCNYYENDDNCIGHLTTEEGVCKGAIPTSGVCKNEDTCFSVYHSCIDVKLLGEKSVDKLEKNLQPKDWIYGENSNKNYTSENGIWKDGWLDKVPEHYMTEHGVDLCN
jgi:hypothetical protein